MNDQTTQPTNDGSTHILDLTSNIVVAFVSNSHMHLQKDDLSGLIRMTFDTLTDLGGKVGATATGASDEAEAPQKREPFTSIRKSVQRDFLISLFDGSKHKMLKRYLQREHNMTPEQYRAEFNLPADYPMVAPSYSEKRRELAKAIGLGTKGRASGKAIEALAEVTDTDPKIVAAEAAGKTPEASAGEAAPAPTKRRGGRRKKAETATAPKRRTRAAKGEQQAAANA